MSASMSPGERLIVALDVPRVTDALALITVLSPVVTVFKIGYWLLFEPHLHVMLDLKRSAGLKFFLDAKLHDIPETVQHGVESAARQGIDFITVHGDDEAMLEAAIRGRAKSDIKVMAVTALTSVPAAAARQQFRVGLLNGLMTHCDGLIMSPADLADGALPGTTVRAMAGNRLIATPGIRAAGQLRQDHARTGTAAMAIAYGADYIIVGRAIVRAPDPLAQAKLVIEEINRAASAIAQPAASTLQHVARD